MPIRIIRNDLTRMQVDAIVTTCSRDLQVTGGVNGAVHAAAGPALAKACEALGACNVGEARITPGFDLPCRYVIHTVSPVWQADADGQRSLLAACYTRSLELALAMGCGSIAFPLIGAGAHGCPAAVALRIAHEAIGAFLERHVPGNDLMVYLVVFTRESVTLSAQLVREVRQYIDDHYVDAHVCRMQESRRLLASRETEVCAPCPAPAGREHQAQEERLCSLEEALKQVDESFSEMVVRILLEKDIRPADCYRRANMDRKLFSKIINNPHYNPKKSTALALAVALELSLEETRELLMKAGYAISHSDKTDIVVEFFIRRGEYDILRINEMLYELDLTLLGSTMI